MGIEFKDYSDEVKEKINDALIAGLYEAAGEIEGQVKRNMKQHSDKGQTRNAWTYRVDESKLIATIGNPLENAIWEELGTGEWAVDGKGRKKTWYVPVDGYTGTKKPTYNGQVVIVYGKEGQKFYKTNGKKPNRALHSAFVTKRNVVIELIKNKLKNIRV